MWLLTLAFALRVAGQALQRWAPLTWLPPYDAWQGSDTPYPVLFGVQVAILVLMARTSWRIKRGTSVASRRVGVPLAWFGGVYMGGSIARLAVGLAVPTAPAWFSAWISGVFHLVLAGFVLTAAHFHLRRE